MIVAKDHYRGGISTCPKKTYHPLTTAKAGV
jgi:hypothetical protein